MITARRRAYLLGRTHLVQLLVLEAAALAVVAAIVTGRHDVVRAVTIGGLAGGLGIAALARLRGRWLPEAVQLGLRVRRRDRVEPDTREPDPRLSVLRRLAPHLAVQDVAGPQGTRAGIGYDGEGWFAVAVISPRPESGTGALDVVPPLVLAKILDPFPLSGRRKTATDASAQAVTLTVSPTLIGGGAMAGTARQERTTWVAIRLEARLLAQTGDDDADSSSRAPYRLLRLARRMPRILESEGLSGRLLDADELLDALQRCCDLLPAAAPVAPRERWTGWSSTNLVHVTYWISRWPATGTEQDLLDELTYVPNAMTAVTLRIFAADERPGADGSAEFAAEVFDLRGLVRVAASADRIEVACTQVARAAQAHGALLRRLDGEHAPAVYATAPTGGGVR